MSESKRPRRSTTVVAQRKVEELPREVAKVASAVERKKPSAKQASGAKAQIIARLKRLHPMD